MKTAICQTNIIFENKAKNITNALEFIKSASDIGVDLILFPEMSFSGFSMNVSLIGESNAYTIDTIRQSAVNNNISIGFGYVDIINGKGKNRYVIIGSSGEILSNYTKIHSFAIGGECDDFSSGNTLPSPVKISSHTVSTFICYDLRFPEIFRAVADNSSLITVAANWPAVRREHWMTLLKARAIENQVYIAGINCTGIQNSLTYCGDSMIIDPLGNIVAQAKSSAEEMIVCEIPNNISEIRSSFPVKDSRKLNLYKDIYSRF